ncbi:MAG: hypothetical protein ABJF10_17325 [Chthoniobacter sp.]|uniref:hypothetical protein n=1 Tax=Chthoniobacter sp. TaxID=2510640 RepID=UPI0032AA5541
MRRRVLGCLVVALLWATVLPVSAEDLAELRWGRKLAHYTPADLPAFDAWVITSPALGTGEGQNLTTVLDAIAHEPTPTIEHFYLADLIQRPDLQKAVMDFVMAQREFQKRPPPTGFGRWEFRNSDQMRALVAQGIMKSPFVAECDQRLAKYGKSIRSVSMEKLFFTKKDGQWGWNASVWLMVDPWPKAPKAVRQK